MRLTKEIKAAIVSKAVRQRFAPDLDALAQRKPEVALAVFRATFDQWPAAPAARPPLRDWVRHTDILPTGGARLMDEPWNAECLGDAGRAKFQLPYDLPLSCAQHYRRLGVSEMRAVPEFEQYEADLVRLHDKMEALAADVRAILASVTTLAALRKQWPEGEALIPEEYIQRAQAPRTDLVPADLVARVNNMLGVAQ